MHHQSLTNSRIYRRHHWGETLTKEKVISLRRTSTKPGRIAHSGYDILLRDGRMEGEYSAGPSNNLSSNSQNENLPADASFIPPPTDLQLPKYFSRGDIRTYNPLLPSHSHMFNPKITSGLNMLPLPGTPALNPVLTSSGELDKPADNQAPVLVFSVLN